MRTTIEPSVVSVADAKMLTGIGITKLYELFADGTLETIHIGRRRLVKVESIRRLLRDDAHG